MRSYISISVLLAALATGVSSHLLGARYPGPVDISCNDSLIVSAWQNITNSFDTYLHGNRSSTPKLLNGLENVTFSAGLFSIHDAVAASSFQYHYTSDEVRTGAGIDEVNGDSIYRVASVSKLFTVLASQIAFKNGEWDRPITDFVAGLAQADLDAVGNDPVRNVLWKDITLRSLASQISGVARAAQPWISDLSLTLPDPEASGLPPLNVADPLVKVPCFTMEFLTDPVAACPPELYLEGTLSRPPVVQSWQTPVYSNNGFLLLGIALANITGKPIAQVYPDLIFGPLGMNNSMSIPPPQSEWSRSVIPGEDASQWAIPGGLSVSSGGIFSSLNDLAKFSTAIMNSTLLPKNKTREWMHPTSHTANLRQAVGAPWEIYRYVHANTEAVTDIYTKLGDSGNFTSFVVLVPDYEAGFNIITASSDTALRSPLALTIADIITSHIIPAMETQAAAEATRNFAGTYKASDETLNSSLTLTFNDTSSDPGIYITQWTSNGTDMMPLIPSLLGAASVKLQPTITRPGEVAFRAMPAKMEYPPGTFLGPFLEMMTVNFDWLATDGLTYGGAGTGQFVFNVGDDGRATAVEPIFLRASLERVE
jgi:CubicO group peptidase (beta-lactamase class C family)